MYPANFPRALASNDESESRAGLHEILKDLHLELEEIKELVSNLENVES